MCDITCTKHFLENEGWDATLLFLFIHSSSCPPNSPLPTYEECNAHRDQQAQFVTEVSHQQLALHENTWEVWIPIWSENSPMQNICQPSYISKGMPTWVQGYFLKWKWFAALHKTDTALQYSTHVQLLSRYLQCLKEWHHAYDKMNNVKCTGL